jgi:alkyl hydroperoxide reductase subunit AhpF
MFKRLFGGSDLDKVFEECRVDKSHEMMITKHIIDLACKYFATRKGSENNNISINININNTLNNKISININNTPQKSGRSLNCEDKRQEFTSFILRKIRSSSDVLRIKGLVLAHSIIMQREFIHQNIISFYCQYLKKFILNIDTYRYAERYLNGGK